MVMRRPIVGWLTTDRIAHRARWRPIKSVGQIIKRYLKIKNTSLNLIYD